MKNLNRIVFSIFLLVLLLLSFFVDSSFFYVDLGQPWQLQPFVHEDSLCQSYKKEYKLLDKQPVGLTKIDSTASVTIILVDAWGVALNPQLLTTDFESFSGEQNHFFLHKRIANRNTHAESVELRNRYENSIYFFGGDSLEYRRTEYIPKLGFKETVFYQNCGDEVMLAKLDSAIAETMVDSMNTQPKMFAWTTQTSRDGNRENLHKTLANIAKLTQKYPEMQFVIQGTHRPILGTPETRRMYHAHWVPVVVVNSKKN